MALCRFCNKWMDKGTGKRKKEFCNTTCRSNFWYGKNKKGKTAEVEESKIQFEAPKEVYDSPKIENVQDEPPMFPRAKTGLKSFNQFAAKIQGLSFADEKEDCMREVMAAEHLSDKEREKLITALKF